MNSRMEGVEASVEIMKGYLQDFKEALVKKEMGDKGKAPMGQQPIASNSLSIKVFMASLSKRTKEIEGEEQTTEGRRGGVE